MFDGRGTMTKACRDQGSGVGLQGTRYFGILPLRSVTSPMTEGEVLKRCADGVSNGWYLVMMWTQHQQPLKFKHVRIAVMMKLD